MQTQLADARQRYTIIYYSEVNDDADSAQLTSETKDAPPFPSKESDTIQLGTPGNSQALHNLASCIYILLQLNHVTYQTNMVAGESSARSKVCVRLSERFDEPESTEAEEDENAECSSSKKQRIN